MTNRNELRRLAEICAAKEPLERNDIDFIGCGTGWVRDQWNFIAAASPEVVLGLLDSIEVLEGWYATVSGQRRAAEAERDQLREEAKQSLVIVGNVGRELGQTQHERDQLRTEIEDRIKAYDICHRQAMDNGQACIEAERERDQLRAVLGKIAEFDPAVTHGWAECVREMARSALKAR